MKDCQAVTFLLVRPDGKILMQKRDDGKGVSIPYPNMWTIPGGGIEKGESPIESVMREIEEEFGLKITARECRSVLVYDHDDVSDNVFLCRFDDSQKPFLHEGAEMKWMTLGEVKILSLAWGQNKILQNLEQTLEEKK